MALNAANTASDVVTALEGIIGQPFVPAQRTMIVNYWTAVVNALYTRIKADMVITSTAPSGTAVATSGTATNQTGTTTAIATSTSTVVV